MPKHIQVNISKETWQMQLRISNCYLLRRSETVSHKIHNFNFEKWMNKNSVKKIKNKKIKKVLLKRFNYVFLGTYILNMLWLMYNDALVMYLNVSIFGSVYL